MSDCNSDLYPAWKYDSSGSKEVGGSVCGAEPEEIYRNTTSGRAWGGIVGIYDGNVRDIGGSTPWYEYHLEAVIGSNLSLVP